MNAVDSSQCSSTQSTPQPVRLDCLGPPLRVTSENAYAKDLRQFRERFGGQVPCDQRTVERYIDHLRDRVAPTTIYRRLMSLRHEHVRLGHASPTDAPALRSILRQLQKGILPHKPGSKAVSVPKRREPRQAKPITRNLLAKMLDAMGSDVLDRRDRCLLLLGFSAALSRSALVSLDVADFQFTADVMLVQLRDPENRDRATRSVSVSITGAELCAATATRDYIRHAALDMEGGPLFRSCDRAGDLTRQRLGTAWISVIVKKRLRDVGVDPEKFSGLSLRRGRIAELAKGVMG